MRLYRIRFGDCDGRKAANREEVAFWATSKREAERIARENDDGDYRSSVQAVDFNPTRQGILCLLNNYACGG